MRIVLATAADGRAYPEHPGGERGCVGGAVVGPVGLLDILAAQLGLGTPPVPPVVRIATWQRKLEEAGQAAPRFWAASLASDGWATARQLLGWRDALVEAGWSPGAVADPPARLADMAAAECAGPPLPRGRADLLREITLALEAGEPSGVTSLELVEAADLLAPGLRRLVRALHGGGTAVRPATCCAPADAASDIGRLHAYLRDGRRERLAGDGTVCEVTAVTAMAAAECIAEWLAHAGDEVGDTVIIVPNGDSGLLDQALARRGLPALGLSPASPYRGALQVLSLCFAVTWAPADPGKLLELLLLPRPPLRRWAARTLAHALAKEPGIGGPAWTSAWERIERRLRDEADAVLKAMPDDTRPRAADPDATLALWRAWVDAGRHDRRVGMPAFDAVALCHRVLDWAIELDAGGRDPLLLCVVGAARALASALAALGRTPITDLQVSRMIDQAIADGLPDPTREAQEGNLRGVTDPGALWGMAHRVIWWDFSGRSRPAPRSPWGAKERAALEAAGCCPEQPSAANRREAAQWQAAALNARSLILVRAGLDRGSEAAPHPFHQKLHPLLTQAGNDPSVRFAAERLFAEELIPLAARGVVRSAAVAAVLPEARATWVLPASLAARATDPGRRESATGFEDLLACQFRWVLKHLAGLREGDARSVPGTERLFGNLAHALAQEAFTPGTIPDPDAVRARATAGLDGLLSRIAAPLLLPGLASELAFARRRIPDALATLAAVLARGRFTVEGVETEHEHDFGPVRVASRVDLLVRGPDGRRGVVDLKWTVNGTTSRRQELAEGRAIQLATYGRLVEPDGSAALAGYFLLRQRKLLAEQGSPLASEEIRVERGLIETWDAVARDGGRLGALAGDGIGVASGIPGADDHLPGDLAFPLRPEVCRFCDMTRLCRSPSAG
jgi:hypothetical protein